jgi:hypothetical protein
MKKIGTMNLILILVGTILIVFTVCMIVLYIKTGGIPDTLCTCVYSACGSEYGFMALIKVFKEKFKGEGNNNA